MIKQFKSFATSFVYLFYPRICHGCGGDLVTGEKFICLSCHQLIEPTNYSSKKENRIYNNMVARIPIEEATSFYYFTKGGVIQNLLHELKYKGKRDVGVYLGELFGQHLLQFDRYRKIDAILPVPLHDKKFKKRGFNQSEQLGKGLSNELTKPLLTNALLRSQFTSTQTNKSRVERWENVEAAFDIKNETALKGKHILLVDDVMTTGATLEACTRKLMQVEGVKISLATLAYTDEL